MSPLFLFADRGLICTLWILSGVGRLPLDAEEQTEQSRQQTRAAHDNDLHRAALLCVMLHYMPVRSGVLQP